MNTEDSEFRILFDHFPVGIGLIGFDRKVLNANPTVCRMLGRSLDELKGMMFSDAILAEDLAEDREKFTELFEGKSDSYRAERRYIRGDGSIFWGRATVSMVRDAQGNPQFAIGLLEDIQEQRNLYETIRESEARFRTLFDNASVGIALMTLDRHIISVNQGAVHIVGYSEAELLEKDPSSLSHPDDREIGMDQFRALIAGEINGFTMEKRYIRKDQRMIWARITYSVVRGADGKPEYVIGMIEDITEQYEARQKLDKQAREYREQLEQRVMERTYELRKANQRLQKEIEQRKQAEDDLRVSQALYHEIFDNTHQQIFLLDVLPDGGFSIVTTNPAHVEATGLKAQDYQGKRLDEILSPEVLALVTQRYQACIESGQPIAYEETAPKPIWSTGNIHTYRTSLAPIYSQDGRITRLVGASTDITEQKRIEAELTRQMQEAAVLAERTRLARDLHDAVTQTLFSASLIAEVLPDLWEMDANEARKSTDELRQLTRGALAEMRTLLLELRPAALTQSRFEDLLKQLVEALVGRARLPIDLEIEGEGKLPPEVQVAFYRIAQESLNNIVKYARASQVRIHLFLSCCHTRLEIADNGVGFDTTELKPTSLGMRIMRERAEAIGAKLDISSVPGEGTQVQVEWEEKG